MKKIVLLMILLSNCYIYALDFNVKFVPERLSAEAIMMIYEENPFYFYRSIQEVKLDDKVNNELVTAKSKDFIIVKIPKILDEGFHKIDLYFDDNAHCAIQFEFVKGIGRDDTLSFVNGYDPDPKTQLGKPRNLGQNPIGIKQGSLVRNPSGGYYAKELADCVRLHKIDGRFTDSVYKGIKEWQGIIPIQGRFSNFYMDYCSDSKILYIMNDWIICKRNTDSSTCYNKFQFSTCNGEENWEVRVYNLRSKKIKVIRNGVDVSEDTNYVVSGAYSFHSSLLEDSLHSMWEFGIKVKGGLFYSSLIRDPSHPLPNTDPKVTTICDEETDYGLVPEPIRVVGNLDENGISIYGNSRYIPTGDVIGGLVIEPNSFAGVLSDDSSSVRVSGSKEEFLFKCSGKHLIDGNFTNNNEIINEWNETKPALGKYSNLYADYCDSVLYILNDWILATEEPDEASCYNLFELFTGGGKEHWGIYVYHDLNKGIKVFRNGVDVSKDSSIVFGGKFGFDASPLKEIKHTIYEFGIKCSPGAWSLFLADPGPSTFCDEDFSNKPRKITNTFGIRKITDNDYGKPGDVHNLLNCFVGDTLNLIIGSNVDTKYLYSRKFEITIDLDTNEFKILEVKKVDSNLLNNSYPIDSFSYSYIDGKLVIELSSQEKFINPGDLCNIKLIAKFNDKEEIKLSPIIKFGNHTSYLRFLEVSELKIKRKSNIVKEQQFESIALFPNPIENNYFKLKMDSYFTGNLELSIIDINGKVVMYEEYHIVAGSNIFNVNCSNLYTGSYFAKLKFAKDYLIIPIRKIK